MIYFPKMGYSRKYYLSIKLIRGRDIFENVSVSINRLAIGIHKRSYILKPVVESCMFVQVCMIPSVTNSSHFHDFWWRVINF